MESKRVDRVSHVIKKEVAEMLCREVKDPRIGMVSITDVKLSKDLRSAHIYYSLVGTEKEIKDAAIGLKHARGFIQRQLGHRVRLRYTPIIDFKIDRSLEYGNHIDKLLQSVSADKSEGTDTTEKSPEKEPDSQ